MRRVLLAAALTFFAGGIFGWLIAQGAGSTRTTTLEPDLQDWALALSTSLALKEEQIADLHVVLAYYGRERRRLLDAQRAHIEPQLGDLDRRFQSLIQDRILDPQRRILMAQMEDPLVILAVDPAPR